MQAAAVTIIKCITRLTRLAVAKLCVMQELQPRFDLNSAAFQPSYDQSTDFDKSDGCDGD